MTAWCAPLCLTLIFCVLPRHQRPIHVADDAAISIVTAVTARPAPVTPTASPLFRLGTAASPFGWSTTVGNLNTDDTPDFVIADRTSRQAGGYTYQLQFAISGLESREVSFASRQAALTVGISDVDDDNDLDVVVSAVPSREVVGIWLNDGGGRFSATAVGRFAAPAPLLQSVSIGDLSVDSAVSGVPPRRAADALPILVPTALSFSDDRFLSSRPGRLHAILRSIAAAPRGPPSQTA